MAYLINSIRGGIIMEKKRVILTCTECLSRNYSTPKAKTNTNRIELMKYCPKCNKHTLHKETKQEEKEMKWFNVKAITKEISKIRWPEKGDLVTNSGQVIIFTAAFGLFFYLCQFLISLVLKALKVIQYGRN